ncbi:ABC transporter substrate-binding protein [Mycoplasmatota bacterium]|nr:ABC transporter substrate-binding protein [Mycoplasmatota bacterium]
MKKIYLAITMIALSAILFACGTQTNETDDTQRVEVSVTHTITTGALESETGTSFDTTGATSQEVTETFLTNPTRVAIFSYDALDILDVIGLDLTSIQMLGVVKSNLPSFLSSYDSNEYENVGTLFMPDWDTLDLFNPELIIVGARSTGAYDTLKENYPHADILDVSLTYGAYSEGLTRNVDNLGKIFPDIEVALDTKLATLVEDMEAINTVAMTHEALFILVNGESLSFYGPNGRFAVLHDEFGFIPADAQAEEGGSHGSVVGYEYVAAVDPEILFLMDRGAAVGGESTLESVINNSLISGTQAGENDKIYILNGEAWYIASGGFTSTQQMIDDLSDFS